MIIIIALVVLVCFFNTVQTFSLVTLGLLFLKISVNR